MVVLGVPPPGCDPNPPRSGSPGPELAFGVRIAAHPQDLAADPAPVPAPRALLTTAPVVARIGGLEPRHDEPHSADCRPRAGHLA